MYEYNRLHDSDIAWLTELCGAGNVFYGDSINEDYTHDEMKIYGVFSPEAVVEVRTAGQVSEIMKYANQRNIPVTPRGSGTGLCGGAVAIHGGILLSLAKMNRIIEFDVDNFTVTVEPGVTLMTLAQEATARGMMYAPDPGEKSATIGGNVMTNAGGMRAIKYGVTRDHVLGMTAVLADGSVLKLGGKIVKNSSGYSIKDLIIGSEGTLAVVTELTLKLLPAPKITLSLLVPFGDLELCLDAVPKILHSGVSPTTVEFMQREVIEATEEYLGMRFPDKSADVYLLLTFDGDSKDALEQVYEKAAEVCIECGAPDVFISDTDQRQESIWKARGAFLEAIKNSTTEMDECDVVVPCNRLVDFLKYVNQLQAKHDLRIRVFGHAGDGNVHVYLCKDALSQPVWDEKRCLMMDELYMKAVYLGGQISGEHGIGHAKCAYLRNSLGEDVIGLMRRIKSAFDPNCILNPGKVCPSANKDSAY